MATRFTRRGHPKVYIDDVEILQALEKLGLHVESLNGVMNETGSEIQLQVLSSWVYPTHSDKTGTWYTTTPPQTDPEPNIVLGDPADVGRVLGQLIDMFEKATTGMYDLATEAVDVDVFLAEMRQDLGQDGGDQ